MNPMTISSGQCVKPVTKRKSMVWVPVLVLVFLPTLAGLGAGVRAAMARDRAAWWLNFNSDALLAL